ncbi:hypothetical protein MHU86_1739 [Fragilaria crotonensis]|nr:hypothetical protein MHU86_1739 [Fragilaria crotonensis]
MSWHSQEKDTPKWDWTSFDGSLEDIEADAFTLESLRDSSDEPMFLPSSSSDEDDVGDTDSESGSMTEQSIPYNSSFSELDSDQKLPATTYATTNTAGLKGMGEEDVFDDEHDSYSDESDAIEEPKPSRTSRLFKIAATVGIGVLSAFTFLTTAKKDDGTDEVDAAGQLINRQGQDVHVAGYHAPPTNNVDTVAGYIPPQPHQAEVAAYVPPPPDGKVSGQATASAKAAQAQQVMHQMSVDASKNAAQSVGSASASLATSVTPPVASAARATFSTGVATGVVATVVAACAIGLAPKSSSANAIAPSPAPSLECIRNNTEVDTVTIRAKNWQTLFTDDEKLILKESFVDIYNNLSLGCNDRYKRELKSAVLQNQTLESNDDKSPILLSNWRGTVLCDACPPESPLFDEERPEGRRKLENVDNGIYLSEFLTIIIEVIDKLLESKSTPTPTQPPPRSQSPNAAPTIATPPLNSGSPLTISPSQAGDSNNPSILPGNPTPLPTTTEPSSEIIEAIIPTKSPAPNASPSTISESPSVTPGNPTRSPSTMSPSAEVGVTSIPKTVAPSPSTATDSPSVTPGNPTRTPSTTQPSMESVDSNIPTTEAPSPSTATESPSVTPGNPTRSPSTMSPSAEVGVTSIPTTVAPSPSTATDSPSVTPGNPTRSPSTTQPSMELVDTSVPTTEAPSPSTATESPSVTPGNPTRSPSTMQPSVELVDTTFQRLLLQVHRQQLIVPV